MACRAYLLLWGEVVHDVEQLTNLFWSLALDHVGDRLAADITGIVRCKNGALEHQDSQENVQQ